MKTLYDTNQVMLLCTYFKDLNLLAVSCFIFTELLSY